MLTPATRTHSNQWTTRNLCLGSVRPSSSTRRTLCFTNSHHNHGCSTGTLLRKAKHGVSRTACRAAAAAQQGGSNAAAISSSDRVLVWLKRDLRLDDHPGLAAAAKDGAMAALYCFDPSMHTHLLLRNGGVEHLHAALCALQRRLSQHSMRLLFRVGAPADVIAAAAADYGADVIVAENDAEHCWQSAAGDVRAALPPSMRWYTWSCSMWREDSYCPNYRTFKAKRGDTPSPCVDFQMPASSSQTAPDNMTATAIANATSATTEAATMAGNGTEGFEEDGAVPSVAKLRELLTSCASPLLPATATSHSGNHRGDQYGENGAAQTGRDHNIRSAQQNSGINGVRSNGGIVVEGVTAADLLQVQLQAIEDPVGTLRSYFRIRNSQSKDGSALARCIAEHDTDASPGACFTEIFGPALEHGAVSPRTIYNEALKFDSEATAAAAAGGRQPPCKPSVATAAAIAVADGADFHRMLAWERHTAADFLSPDLAPRHFRWRGFLTDYIMCEPSTAAEANSNDEQRPAILLIHGFGAFGEQWRRNVPELAAAGYLVFAPTMPGYGSSEKPPQRYSQHLWTDFVRDFLVDVVRQPAIVVGNSIGGFIAANLAAQMRDHVPGLILLNTSGTIVPDYKPPPTPPKKVPPPKFLVDGVSWALLVFLERSTKAQLKKLYPRQPHQADEWLTTAILRAACDLGSFGVFRCVFYLPPPPPITHLIKDVYGRPTFVLQGAKDPLNNAVLRAKQLQSTCPNVSSQLVDAGHCPHDEVPDVVNSAIVKFIETRVMAARQDVLAQSA